MKVIIFMVSLFLFATLSAEVKIELKDMHICCKACVNGITKATANVKGVKVEVNKEEETTSIVAETIEAGQNAIDAILTAGYHAATSTVGVLFPSLKVKSEKVKTLTVTGAHNCCAACSKDINMTVKSVQGVTSCDVKSKAESFTVTGDFDAKDLSQALEKAGYHFQLK